MIVTQETQNALIELIGECFKMNRFCDRAVSVLGVKFVYNNTADLVHVHIAHYFPDLSDKIGELCLERYNIPVVYPATPAGMQDYSSAEDIVHDIEEKVIDFQAKFMGACKVAFDNNDIHVYADLLDLLEDLNKVVEQVILLADKIDKYDGSMSYDSHVGQHFWILGDNEDD